MFMSIVLPILLYGCETWTLTVDLERRIEPFGNKCLSRITGYCWFDRVTNRCLLSETGSRPIAYTIWQPQLMQHGHVARFLEVDPAYWGVFERDSRGWRRPMGRPKSSWLGKFDEPCYNVLRMGNGPACRLDQKNPRKWQSRLGKTTRHLSYAPFDWLTVMQMLAHLWVASDQLSLYFFVW